MIQLAASLEGLVHRMHRISTMPSEHDQ